MNSNSDYEVSAVNAGVVTGDLEEVRRFVMEESKKKRERAKKLVIEDRELEHITNICSKIYPFIYPFDDEVMRVPSEPAWDQSIFVTDELRTRKGCIWYSAKALGLDKSGLYHGDVGGYDPLSEILMAPDVFSVHDAEERFTRIFIRSAIRIDNPVMEYCGLLARMAFRDMCLSLADRESPDAYPSQILTDNMVSIAAALDDGIEADTNIVFGFEDEGFPPRLLANMAEMRDAVRTGCKTALIELSRFISRIRSSFSEAGICSFWGDCAKNVMINVDGMNLTEITTAFSLLQLYYCGDQLLAAPELWENKDAAKWLSAAGIDLPSPRPLREDGILKDEGRPIYYFTPAAVPTENLHNIRVRLVSANASLMDSSDAIAQLEKISYDKSERSDFFTPFDDTDDAKDDAGRADDF